MVHTESDGEKEAVRILHLPAVAAHAMDLVPRRRIVMGCPHVRWMEDGVRGQNGASTKSPAVRMLHDFEYGIVLNQSQRMVVETATVNQPMSKWST